jgi:hypothetical protein
VNVDAVQQRPGYSGNIALDQRWRAGAFAGRVIEESAWVQFTDLLLDAALQKFGYTFFDWKRLVHDRKWHRRKFNYYMMNQTVVSLCKNHILVPRDVEEDENGRKKIIGSWVRINEEPFTDKEEN